MDNDEPVPTSDPEELEEFKAGSPSYWRGREQLRLRAHTVDADMVALGDVRGGPGVGAEGVGCFRIQRVPGSPWKRRKVRSSLTMPRLD